MKLVMRSNKQTCVADERLDDFLKRGFVEVDGKTGKPLCPLEEKEERSAKKEAAALKKENEALTERVAALEGEKRALMERMASLPAQSPQK